MISLGIPSWFREENEDKNIWKPPFDYKLIGSEIDALEQGLIDGWKETDIQQFLKKRPYLFDGLYPHGHGTYVFYEQSFGGKYIADWVIGNGHSAGIFWDLIELEAPQFIPFKQDGHFGDAARKGVNQIQDWRTWLTQNNNMVERPKSNSGLGLFGFKCHAHGTVVGGRRELYQSKQGSQAYNQTRETCRVQNRIKVISYESLIEKMRFHI